MSATLISAGGHVSGGKCPITIYLHRLARGNGGTDSHRSFANCDSKTINRIMPRSAPDWTQTAALIDPSAQLLDKQHGDRFTKYLTTILRLSYDNAKVTIDLRRTSNLQKHPTKGARLFLGTIHLQSCKIVRDSVRKLAYDIPKRNFSTF